MDINQNMVWFLKRGEKNPHSLGTVITADNFEKSPIQRADGPHPGHHTRWLQTSRAVRGGRAHRGLGRQVLRSALEAEAIIPRNSQTSSQAVTKDKRT